MDKQSNPSCVYAVPRNMDYSRRVRRAIQKSLPRGDTVIFEDEAKRRYTDIDIDGLLRNNPFGVISTPITDKEAVRRSQDFDAALEIMDSNARYEESLSAQTTVVYNILKRRGLIAGNFEDLARACLMHWPIQAAKVLSGGSNARTSFSKSTIITKAMWMDAIYDILCIHQADGPESAIYNYDVMLQRELDEGDTELLGVICVQVFGILCTVCEKKSLEVENLKLQKKLEAAEKKVASVKNSAKVDRLQQQMKDMSAKHNAQLLSLQQELTDLAASKQNTEEKNIQRIARLEEELAIYRSIEQQAEEVDEVITDDVQLLELPEDSVMFVGGHPNLIAKLRAEHRSWRFVSSVSDVPEPVLCKHVFYYSRYVSHKVQYKLQRYYNGPIMYCDGTSLDRLYQSMREVYTLCAMKEVDAKKVHI